MRNVHTQTSTGAGRANDFNARLRAPLLAHPNLLRNGCVQHHELLLPVTLLKPEFREPQRQPAALRRRRIRHALGRFSRADQVRDAIACPNNIV